MDLCLVIIWMKLNFMNENHDVDENDNINNEKQHMDAIFLNNQIPKDGWKWQSFIYLLIYVGNLYTYFFPLKTSLLPYQH